MVMRCRSAQAVPSETSPRPPTRRPPLSGHGARGGLAVALSPDLLGVMADPCKQFEPHFLQVLSLAVRKSRP
jgi:hypothetical protein